MHFQYNSTHRQKLPFNPNFDLPIRVVQGVEPALHQQRPLDTESGNQEVEAHSTEAVTLQKCHQEAKPHKDHHMYILETCRRQDEKNMNLMLSSW